jgi:hypothetical protein
LDDLAAVCTLGPEQLARVRQRLDGSTTISRRKIQEMVDAVLAPPANLSLVRFLMSVGVTLRRRSTKPAEFVEGVTRYLPSLRPADTRFASWGDCRPELEQLLGLSSVVLAAKAYDISYDFERVFTAARLITSIRPVFKEGEKGDKDDIVGSTVVQTLRLEYASHQGKYESLSIALDLDDVEKLRKSCVEALAKARASVALMEEKCQIEATMIGEVDE